jgi:hypothetical protein
MFTLLFDIMSDLSGLIKPFSAILAGVGVGIILAASLERTTTERARVACMGDPDRVAVSFRGVAGTVTQCLSRQQLENASTAAFETYFSK